MNNIDLQEILLKFGHYIALGVAVVVVGFTFVSGMGNEDLKELNTLMKEKELLDRKMKEKPPLPEPLPDYLPKIKENWQQDYQLTSFPSQDAFYPSAEFDFVFEPAPADKWISKPGEITLDEGREKIGVSWLTPSVLMNPETGEERVMSEIEGYELVKTWKDGGKTHEKRFYFPPTQTRFVDSQVESRIKYSYKVRSYTNNTKAKGGDLAQINGKEVVASDFTREKEGEILPLYRMKLLGVANQTAIIELEKFQQGDWREATCYIKKNQPIQTEKYIKELDQKITFDPKWKLVDLRYSVKRRKKVEREVVVIDPESKKPKIDPDTGQLMKKTITKTVEYSTAAIRYLDEKNILRTRFSR